MPDDVIMIAEGTDLKVDVVVTVLISPSTSLAEGRLSAAARQAVDIALQQAARTGFTHMEDDDADMSIMRVAVPVEPNDSVEALLTFWRLGLHAAVIAKLEKMHPCATAHLMTQIVESGRTSQTALRQITNLLTDCKVEANRRKYGLKG